MSKFNNFKFSSRLITKESFSRDSVLISLESPKAFISFLMKYSFKIIKLCIHRERKVVAKIRMFHNFGRYLLFLNRNHGSLFVVKYLKASQLAVQRKLAGQPFKSLRELEPDLNLPRLSKSGLPAFIGSRDRRAILGSSYSVIQLGLSLFGLYRVIKAPVIPKLNTITDSFSGNSEFLNLSLGRFSYLTKRLIRKDFKFSGFAQILLLETSSPSAKKSFFGLTKDAVSLRHHGMDDLIEKGMSLTQNTHLLDLFKLLKLKVKVPFSKAINITYIHKHSGFVLTPEDVSNIVNTVGADDLFISSKCLGKYPDSVGAREFSQVVEIAPGREYKFLKPGLNIGQFAFKEEAAGKLRIFAMVDLGTQSLMKPLHDSLFAVLKKLPNDGTFDQNAAFDRAVIKSHVSGCCFGYDLSAATDRLPIIIQQAILESLIGSELANLGTKILVQRPYAFTKNPYELVGELKYAVGQPMGALSSGAMLALSHHMILQYCSSLLGKPIIGNTDYEVLGDDIVIFDKNLASKYVEIMDHLGVPLNVSKSVISIQKSPVVEFAKRTSYNTVDVSPISGKMFLNQDTFAGRVSVVNYGGQRHKSFIFSSFKTILQANLGDNRPIKNEHSYLSLLTSMANKGLVRLDGILAKISEKKHMIKPFGKAILIDFPFQGAKTLLVAIARGKDLDQFRPYSYSFAYSLDERYHSAAVRKEIKKLLNKYTEEFFKDYVDKLCLEFSCRIIKRDLYMHLFSGILLYRSYRFINLDHFEFPQLMQIYEQLLNKTSEFRLLDEKRKKPIITNSLSTLKFIERSNRAGNRKDPSICPLTFVTYGPGIMVTGFQQRH